MHRFLMVSVIGAGLLLVRASQAESLVQWDPHAQVGLGGDYVFDTHDTQLMVPVTFTALRVAHDRIQVGGLGVAYRTTSGGIFQGRFDLVLPAVTLFLRHGTWRDDPSLICWNIQIGYTAPIFLRKGHYGMYIAVNVGGGRTYNRVHYSHDDR